MSKSPKSLSRKQREADERLKEEIKRSLELLQNIHVESAVSRRKFQREMRKLDKEIAEHDAAQNYGAVPKRRMRLRKSASKHKAKKTRSQYASKKVSNKRKTMKY